MLKGSGAKKRTETTKQENAFEKFEEIFFMVLYVIVALFAHKKLTYEFSVPKYAIFSLGFTIILTATVIYLIKKGKYTIKINLGHVFLFGFATAALLSTINVLRDRPFYFRYSIDIALYTLLNAFSALYISNRWNDKKRIIRFIFLMILTAGFISYDALLNFYTGKDIFLGTVGKPFTRASIKATIGNTIFVANYLGMVIPTTLYFILSYSVGLREKRITDEKMEYIKIALMKILATISLILMIITVIVSQTRSEYGGVFLTNLFFFIFYFIYVARKEKHSAKEFLQDTNPDFAKRLSRLQKILIIVAVIVVSLTVFLYNIPSPLTGHGRFTAAQRVQAMLSTGSWDERMLAWLSSYEQWKTHKIFGTGIGTYQILTISFMGDIIEKHPRFIWGWNNFKRTHNDYFQVLGETGVVGLIFILALLVYLVVYFFRTIRKIEDKDDALLFIALAMGFADFAIQSFFSFPGHLLPNTLTAIFLASVALSDRFNKDDWMTFKISFKKLSYIVASVAVIILVVTSTFMRWNYFISEVHFKAGNTAYMALLQLRKAESELRAYDKQLLSDMEDLKNLKGRFSYLKDLESYKKVKLKELQNTGRFQINNAALERMRIEEISKWSERLKKALNEIRTKYQYVKNKQKEFYAKALRELTTCLSMNHTYGKAYFYLAALSVQPERIKFLTENVKSVDDYKKLFIQNYDIFHKFIHPSKKRNDLDEIAALMELVGIEKVENLLKKSDIITFQALLDSISLYETSLLVFNERNTYKALAARFASLDSLSRIFRRRLKSDSTLKEDPEVQNVIEKLTVASERYYEDFISYAKTTVHNLPGSWNRFPDWKHYDVRRAVKGEDIYRYFANIAIRIKSLTDEKNLEFLTWLAKKEIWATEMMEKRGVWGVPDMVFDFMHAIALYYSTKKNYEKAASWYEKILNMYEDTEIRIREEIPKRRESAENSLKKLAELLSKKAEREKDWKLVYKILEQSLEEFSKHSVWVSVSANEMREFLKGNTSFKYDIWSSLTEKTSGYISKILNLSKDDVVKTLKTPTHVLIYERYLRFDGHYRLVLNDAKNLLETAKKSGGVPSEHLKSLEKKIQKAEEIISKP